MRLIALEDSKPVGWSRNAEGKLVPDLHEAWCELDDGGRRLRELAAESALMRRHRIIGFAGGTIFGVWLGEILRNIAARIWP